MGSGQTAQGTMLMTYAEQSLVEWVKTHSGNALDPREVGKAYPYVDAIELAVAVENRVRSGKLRRTYRVVAPDGTFAEAEFGDVRQIPSKLEYRNGQAFDTENAEVVPFFFSIR